MWQSSMEREISLIELLKDGWFLSVETELEAQQLLLSLHTMGLKWITGESLVSDWNPWKPYILPTTFGVAGCGAAVYYCANRGLMEKHKLKTIKWNQLNCKITPMFNY